MNRTVKLISYAQEVDMGGFPVRQPLPTRLIDQLDPFLLLHHAEVKYSAGRKQSQVGVGPHPHRGFSPVSFIYQGGVHHRDSMGNDHVVMEGGLQWMNSGRGTIHSERPPKDMAENGGVQEFIQLWINTPQSKKMNAPSYQPLTKEDTPMFISDDKKVTIGVQVGEYNGAKSPIQSDTEVIALRADFQKDGVFTFKLEKKFNVFAYVLNGKINVENHGLVEEKNLIIFNQDGDIFTITAKENSQILVLAGVPLNEPLETYGPFVMNTTTEIMEAIRDYQMGKMGVLIEEFN
jgi:quercetin 2,3-dioxygenase